LGSELRHPPPHRLIGDVEAAFSEQVLDVSEAERETKIEPGVGDFVMVGRLSTSSIRLAVTARLSKEVRRTTAFIELALPMDMPIL
jgi:hypothetical protein